MAARNGLADDDRETMAGDAPEADALEIGDPDAGYVVLDLLQGRKVLGRLKLDRDDLKSLALHLYTTYELIEDLDGDELKSPEDDVAGHA